MEQKYGVSLIKGFTGMTSKWEEEKIQGEKMQKTQIRMDKFFPLG